MSAAAAPAPDFRLYHGNDLALLAGILAHALAQPAPGQGVLAPDTILIPQPAMRRWLQKQLAQAHGIAANLRFLAPGEFVAEALKANLPGGDDGAVGEAAVLRWRLWSLLADPALLRERVFAPLRPLLGGGDARAAWTLAGELATAFEKYQAWRRDWLRRWDHGGDREDWQAELWRRATRGLSHRGKRLDAYLSRFDGDAAQAPAGLPPRLFAFACQNVSPDVLRVIASAARAGPLHFFFLSPVQGWWGDLRTARERLHADGEDVFADGENPLLRANGAAGRDFVRTLFSYEVVHPIWEQAVYVPPDPATRSGLLHRLQRDLLARRTPGAEEQTAFKPGDASLQVHSCHTRLREVQVLHAQLRALLESDPTLQPRDIAVLTPDMDQYAAFVHAVFGAEASDRHAIPYALGDASTIASQPVAEAFARLLDLPGARFGANEVLDLLAVKAVSERFGLEPAELDQARDWLAAAGVRWGLDARHKAELDAPPDAAFSWAWALDRLLLGHAAGSDADIAGVAPLPVLEGASLDLLDRLLQGLRRLAHWRVALAAPRTPELWSQALAKLVDDFFPELARSPADREAIAGLRMRVAGLARQAARAGVEDEVPFAVVRAWVQAALAEDDARQPFLTGGVTFGRMVPMRLVPFRVIALLGLNDGEFPRRDPPGSLNRLVGELQGARRPGDRSVRDDDRALFLQLFAAATDALLLSYLGQDPRSGESLPPSVVVSELLDAAEAYFTDPVAARRGLVAAHPLQPFAPAGARQPPRPFAAGVPPRPEGEAAGALDWTRDQLVRALCHPPREFLCERLGLRLPEGSERMPDEEPFDSRDGLGRYQLNQRVFELQVQQPAADADQLARRLLAEGLIAPAAAGEAAVHASLAETAPAIAAWLAADGGAPRSQPYSLDLAGVRLSGALERVFPDGLRQFSASHGHGKTLVALGVDVLLWSALGETRPVLRVLRDGVATLITPLPVDVAHAKLAQLLRLAMRARREPLPLMPKAGALLACHDDPAKAQRAAYVAWTGTGGEGSDPWVRLALRGAMPFEQEDATLRMSALARSLFLGLPGGLPCADLDELTDGD